jgi:hypothetical protein
MVAFPLTIPAGQSLSAPLRLSAGLKITRIATPPDAWDKAPLTFQISLDGTDWRDLYNVAQTKEGPWFAYEANISAITAGSILLMPQDAGLGVAWLKLRSGTHVTPVKQTADRVFGIVCS